MKRYERQRFLISTVVWSVVLIGGTGMLAVRFGWLPFELGEAGAGTLGAADSAAPVAEPGAPPPVDIDREAAAGLPRNGDPVVFAEQSEPGTIRTASGEPEYQRVDEPRRLLTEQFDDPPRPIDPPANPPAFVDAARNSGSGRRPSRTPNYAAVPVETPPAGRVTLISAEDPAPESATPPPTATIPAPANGLDLAAVDETIARRDYAAAHRDLSKIHWDQPQHRAAIRERIELTANSIFFAPQPHYMEPYEIQTGDRLTEIGKTYSVPWQYLVRLNQVDPRRIRPGQKLKVVKGPFHAVVDLKSFELTVHTHGYYVRRYPVGIGRDGRTPLGKFTVQDKVVNPQYTSPEGQVLSGDDPANPLGERWLNLGDGYGIHGTIEPQSIGKAESRGCIRMLNDDVAEVYDMLGIGSEVLIRP